MTGRALVTGGGVRLGAAMALYLAGRGHGVAVHYNSSDDDARRLVEKIRNAGGEAVAIGADLLDMDAAEALAGRAADALGGPLTCLVNNASIFEQDRLGTITDESWARHLGSNLEAPVRLTQTFAEAAPRAIADGAGEPRSRALVVNMIDQRVRKPTPHFASYTLAKSALWTFTRTAAQALAPDIRVNAIGPGPTLRGARQSVEHFAAQRRAVLLGRGANEGDITRALGFFLDSPAVTGQLICVDGGQHLAWQTPDTTISE